MCDCITKLDEHLAAHNSRLQVSFLNEGGHLVERPHIGTEKINKRDRRSMGAVPSFCPFCGERYGSEAASTDSTKAA
jgi:hypothetical protein